MKQDSDVSSRSTPQSQPSKQSNTTSALPSSSTATDHPDTDHDSSNRSSALTIFYLPLLLVRAIRDLLSVLISPFVTNTEETIADLHQNQEVFRNKSSPNPEIFIPASPALTTLLDTALYHAHEAELVPTTCAASKLLQYFIEMKEASALIVRECRWSCGVPFTPLEIEEQGVAVGAGGIILENDVIVSGGGNSEETEQYDSSLPNHDVKWNEFEMIQDFALQCLAASKEAIHRLSTDRLAESANLTLHDSMSAILGEEGKKDDGIDQIAPGSDFQQVQQESDLSFDAEIGRCYLSQPRSSCWESSRLYCPDYSWADDCITLCQRLLRNLSKHKFMTLMGAAHGWNRFVTSSPSPDDNPHIIFPPKYASCEPHPFPSLEAIHGLKYLASDLLSKALPSHLNQFRAAVEANAVVTKRLFLVKCEYRAPIRAHMESWMALKAAPKLELVERYLADIHGTNTIECETKNANAPVPNKGNTTKKKHISSSSAEPPVLQKRRDSLENLIAEQWKHPSFLEALQIERSCEKLESEMSQILSPLSHLATEVMEKSRGRIRAVAVLINDSDKFANGDKNDGDSKLIEELLGWKDVPHLRELLKSLKTILRRKPMPDESSGIRPLLLDLQGVPRHNNDSVDISTEVPFYKSLHQNSNSENKWYYLEQFIQNVEVLLKLIAQPGTPFLMGNDDKGSRRWQQLVENCTEAWNADLFQAQYQDWFDMVIRQHELNDATDHSSLSYISETIREAEIEVSIAMASVSQLKMVRERLEALILDNNTKYMVLAQIINDVALRELNENIVVLPITKEMSSDFPKLSAPGLFGNQLRISEEVLPLG